MKKTDHSIEDKEKYTLELIKKTRNLFFRTVEFEKLAKNTVETIIKIKIKDLKLQGSAIFRIDPDGKNLRSYFYNSINPLLIIENYIDIPFNSLVTPIDKPVNLMGKSISLDKICMDKDLSNFISPPVNKSIAKILQRLAESKIFISLPIKYNNKIVGAILTGMKYNNIPDYQIDLIQTFSDQVGLAMGNVIAHERIIEQFKEKIRKKKAKKKQASIKFTIRIPKSMDKFLTWKVHNTRQSKAKFVRKFLEKKIENDEEFKKYG
ncbi:MAG: hypothetical protein ACD_63C00228G0001 [uncultured bacterium]|nr:MAG: hypothetical protein ACD_63C00228G0001 [uncultured bacterium]